MQIKTSLDAAQKELLEETTNAPPPDPSVVATEVEAALSNAYGVHHCH